MSTYYQVVDVTSGAEIWSLNDPPQRVRRYGLGKFSDGAQVQGDRGIPVGEKYDEPFYAARAANQMNEDDES